MGSENAVDLSVGTRSAWDDRLPGPPYDRADVAGAVVHLGVGGFHRAHEAMFHDRLLAAGELGWGICGVGVIEQDAAMRDALSPQDGLYTLVEKAGDGSVEARVIGSLLDYLLVADDREAVIERMADERTRIVSLTITEGGYGLEPGPGPAFGLIAEALERRRERGGGPFTVMSCDNLEGNGELARAAVLEAARRRDDSLAEWTGREGAFPSSTVDRITPATTDGDRDEVRERYGVRDRWPVVCEPFVQWVLEDEFCAGRPPYEDVGVQVVDDVEPYELMKLRLLNGSHQALAYFGELLGYEYAHDAAVDDDLRPFVRGYMDDEATPTLPPVPGVDLDEYKDTLLERFANPALRDTVARLGFDAPNRIAQFVLPVVRARLAADEGIERCVAIVAAWARCAADADDRGDPETVLGDLLDDERFAHPYRETLAALEDEDARAVLRRLAG